MKEFEESWKFTILGYCVGLKPAYSPLKSFIQNRWKPKGDTVMGRKKRKSDARKVEMVEEVEGPSSSAEMIENKLERYPLHRCFISHYASQIESAGLRECHYDLLQTTPFGVFVNIPPMTFESVLLREVVSNYVKGEEFSISGKRIKFTVDDVSLITGLPCSVLAIKLNGRVKKSRLHNLWDGEKLVTRRDSLFSKMTRLAQTDDEQAVKDVLSLWIAYMYATFLLPNSNFFCPPHILFYLENVDAIQHYNWTVAIHSMLLQKIEKVASIVRSRMKGKLEKTCPYLAGCTTILCAWFLEHFGAKPTNYNDSIPRLFRWYKSTLLRKDNLKKTILDKMKKTEVIEKLQPSSISQSVQRKKMQKLEQVDEEDEGVSLKEVLLEMRTMRKNYDKSQMEIKSLRDEVRDLRKVMQGDQPPGEQFVEQREDNQEEQQEDHEDEKSRGDESEKEGDPCEGEKEGMQEERMSKRKGVIVQSYVKDIKHRTYTRDRKFSKKLTSPFVIEIKHDVKDATLAESVISECLKDL